MCYEENDHLTYFTLVHVWGGVAGVETSACCACYCSLPLLTTKLMFNGRTAAFGEGEVDAEDWPHL